MAFICHINILRQFNRSVGNLKECATGFRHYQAAWSIRCIAWSRWWKGPLEPTLPVASAPRLMGRTAWAMAGLSVNNRKNTMACSVQLFNSPWMHCLVLFLTHFFDGLFVFRISGNVQRCRCIRETLRLRNVPQHKAALISDLPAVICCEINWMLGFNKTLC